MNDFEMRELAREIEEELIFLSRAAGISGDIVVSLSNADNGGIYVDLAEISTGEDVKKIDIKTTNAAMLFASKSEVDVQFILHPDVVIIKPAPPVEHLEMEQ